MRRLTEFTGTTTERLLDVLTDQGSSAESYQEAMTGLGRELGSIIAPEVDSACVCVVCTVEDADFLARGVLEGLAEAGLAEESLRLVCFWNERVRSFQGSDLRSFDIAPVMKQYSEIQSVSGTTVVVVKSIISGACVVKTNLAMLLDDVVPERVFVAAPVMLEGAPQRLASEFTAEVAAHFEYRTFAIDDQKDDDENVLPGIGGSVYERLGFADKNAFVPQIVKQRRTKLPLA